ncbi:MAG: DNA primase DnaG [Halobacteriales archaeon]
MQDSDKYLIHATVEADGVVERSDVVGAVFGQTEGLLGDELDLRELKESSKVGRINVDVESEDGRSYGELTVASNLDKVETAVLAAGLETIERVGPCHADLTVTGIEDVRAAKRRAVVDRAKDLLATGFDESVPSTQELLEEVRRSVRVADITEYDGLPAGPNVATSDAIIVVEGRADVIQLLEYGIKNAIAVEGTDVPDGVAELTEERTVTAFLDGDRGGDLILAELAQVGEVDYVAIAPPGESVEELDRQAVMAALRDKVGYDDLRADDGGAEVAATDGSVRPAPSESELLDAAKPDATDASSAETDSSGPDAQETGPDIPDPNSDDAGPDAADAGLGDSVLARGESIGGDGASDESGGADAAATKDAGEAPSPDEDAGADDGSAGADATDGEVASEDGPPETVRGHVEDVVGSGRGTVRLLDEDVAAVVEAPADEAFERVESAEEPPTTVVLDGVLTQRLLDVAAQRGVAQVVAHEFGDFVKRPTNVRIRTAEQVLAS